MKRNVTNFSFKQKNIAMLIMAMFFSAISFSQTYDMFFWVTAGTLIGVEGAAVTIGDETIYTDFWGLAVFEGYDPETIKAQIINICSDYFLNIRRRDKIPRSDLIAAVEGIEGVDSVSLYYISEENELSKTQDPNAEEVGLDEFGDILIGQDEIPVISGGWEDRNGIYYDTGAGTSALSSINIDVRRIVPNTYNAQMNSAFKKSLRTGN